MNEDQISKINRIIDKLLRPLDLVVSESSGAIGAIELTQNFLFDEVYGVLPFIEQPRRRAG